MIKRNYGIRYWKTAVGALILTAGLLLFPGTMQQKIWAAEDEQLVYDRADLLSDEEEQQLEEEARSFFEKSELQIFLVTTEDAEGKSSMEYAEDFYMDHQTTLDGGTCLIDMDNREIYLATSGDLRYYVTDSNLEKLLDDAYEYVSDEEYGETFTSMLENLEKYYARGIQDGTYLVDEDTGEITVYREPKRITVFEFLIALAAGLGVAGAIFGVTAAKYKMKWKKDSYDYRENFELKLTREEDRFVNRVVTHRHIPKDPPASGGGGGGGHSTVHTGSGGNSFGGGGRKF